VPYPITLSDGVTTLITVPDLAILGPSQTNSPSNCSLNLIGRGATNFGDALDTNFVWLLQNFASATSPVQPLAGQLWYNNTSGASSLNIYNSAGKWVQVATGDVPFTMSGNLIVEDGVGDLVEIYGSGAIRLQKTNYLPHVTFEGFANSTNCVTLSLGTDSFGSPDLTIHSPVFPSATPGFIWHSDNVTPFDLEKDNTAIGNNAFTGINTFTSTMYVDQIISNISNGVTNAVPYVSISPGNISVVNVDNVEGPQFNLASPNPASPNFVSVTFADPEVLFDFFASPSSGNPGINGAGGPGLVRSGSVPRGTMTFTPSTDISGENTVYHTGNLLPIIQNPDSGSLQTIAGSLALSNSGILTVSGAIVGNGGGQFTAPLTVGGNEVFTITGGTITGAVTINSYLNVTGGAKVTSGFFADGITSSGGYVNLGSTGDGNLIPQVGFYTTAGYGVANLFADLSSTSSYNIGLSFNNSNLVGAGAATQTGIWYMTSDGDVYNTRNLTAQADIATNTGSVLAPLGVFAGGGFYSLSQSTGELASVYFGLYGGGSNVNTITGFTAQISSYNNTLVFIAGGGSATGQVLNGMVLDAEGDLTLYTSSTGAGNFYTQNGSFNTTNGGFTSQNGGNFATTSGNFTSSSGNFSTATGAMYATAFNTSSDARLKTNITNIDNALELVAQLRGVRYTRKDSKDNSPEIGVIAQEVKEVVPELVSENEDGMLVMAYGNALALCINAINELRARVEQLEAKA